MINNMGWQMFVEGRKSRMGGRDEEELEEMLEEAYEEGCKKGEKKGYRKAMREMGEYGERGGGSSSGGYSGGSSSGSSNYGNRMEEYDDDEYEFGERRGVKGTGRYSRYRR